MSWWQTILAGMGIGLGNESSGAAVSNAQDAGGLVGIAEAFTGFFAHLTNGAMWKSLGWIALGIILMLLGVAWWIGPSASRAGPGTIAAGVLA